MNRSILFYVSGHGFGHARRDSQVIRAIVVANAEVQILVRTTAPSQLFAGIPRTSVHVPTSPIDSGMAERDPLTLDIPRTLQRIHEVLDKRQQTIAAELAFIRQHNAGLILSDIPYLPGKIAAAAGLPCLAIGNFTWDWIYHPLLADEPAYARIEEQIQAMYGRMTGLLRLPFAHSAPFFKQVTDVPLVAHRCQRQPGEILAQLKLDPADPRPRILLGMRGGLADATLRAAVASAPEFLFLSPQPFPGDAPANFRHVPLSSPSCLRASVPSCLPLDFSDLLRISRAVVSKLGYGIVADCIANDTPILWPRRGGFREEEIFITQGPRFMRMREIAPEDFNAGRWTEDLRRLLDCSPPPQKMPVNGAEICARHALRAAGITASE